MKIQGSRFAVTGGNRGIGLAVAEMAARQGAHVYLACRSPEDGLAERLVAQGAKSATLWCADLASRAGCEALATQLAEADIDILFNNAGLLTGGLLEQQGLDEIYDMFQVNLNAVVHLTRAVLPVMLKKNHGKIINNASVSAFMHFPCATTYAASKAAVVAFTNCLQAELGGSGVTALCLVTPGVKTRMFDAIDEKYGKHLEVPRDSISADQYAAKIRRAIEDDSRELMPSGATALGLWTARYLNPLFRSSLKHRFHR